MSRPATIIEIGTKVGKLTVGAPVRREGRRGVFYQCTCDCGTETTVYAGHLRAAAKSCGCVRNGGKRSHGMSHTPEYRAWENARSRCINPRNRKYPDYGGRGITMCQEWSSSFKAFFDHMGVRPSNLHSLDRINTDGAYEPGNCRWATWVEQNNNRRPMKRRSR